MALMLGSASPAPATSEQELIDAGRIGDDRAFEELYARYRDRIEAFIRSRMRDHARAEDVAQEVFISALRRLRSSDQEISFKPWIYEIAKNACIDEHRRRQRSREVSLDADEQLANGSSALLSIAPTPPAAMESKQKLDDLRGAFGGLSESHHQLLVMREFEGLSYDEIGRQTGMSRQMVESALFRARRKLGVEYEELASGRRCLQVQTAIEAGKLTSRRALGARERRQLARHLAHCQACRVKGHLAGVDESFTRSGVAAKIAALLPFPALRWWPFGRAARLTAMRTGSHSGLPVAAGAFEPGASGLLGGAAVAVVALAIAGSGGTTGAPGHRSARPERAAGGAHVASPPRSVGSESEFGPGLGTVRRVLNVSGIERLGHSSAAAAHPAHRQSVSRRPGTSSSSRSGAPTRTSRRPVSAAAAALAATAGPEVDTTVKPIVTSTAKSVQNTTQSVGKTLGQMPMTKAVAKVLSSAPALTGSGSPIPPAGSPSPLSSGGNVPATVQNATKKLTDGVGSLMASH
jgi:RNA polymerase sigma factor (sigma-70 family)